MTKPATKTTTNLIKFPRKARRQEILGPRFKPVVPTYRILTPYWQSSYKGNELRYMISEPAVEAKTPETHANDTSKHPLFI